MAGLINAKLIVAMVNGIVCYWPEAEVKSGQIHAELNGRFSASSGHLDKAVLYWFKNPLMAQNDRSAFTQSG